MATDINPNTRIALSAFWNYIYRLDNKSRTVMVPSDYNGTTYRIPFYKDRNPDVIPVEPCIDDVQEEEIVLSFRFICLGVVIDYGYGKLTRTFAYKLRKELALDPQEGIEIPLRGII